MAIGGARVRGLLFTFIFSIFGGARDVNIRYIAATFILLYFNVGYLCASILFRLLQHTGRYPDNTDEPDGLASGRTNVESVTLLLKNWFG